MRQLKSFFKIFFLIIFILSIIWILFVVVLPKKFVIQPSIKGKVIDKYGQPIKGAVVYQLKEEYKKNKDFGYEESYIKIIDKQVSNNLGVFIFKEKVENKWFHLPILKPTNLCEINLEVKKNGYLNYKTKKGELEKYNDKYYHCECITFEPNIVLQRNYDKDNKYDKRIN